MIWQYLGWIMFDTQNTPTSYSMDIQLQSKLFETRLHVLFVSSLYR